MCPNVQVSGTNQDASVDACSGCSDGASTAGNFCYSLENTIWYMFTTDSDGGDVSVDLTGINCVSGVGLDNELQGVIIEAGVPCDESTYNLMSNCPTASGTMNLSATGLNPNTTYYIQIMEISLVLGLQTLQCAIFQFYFLEQEWKKRIKQP